jgi:hypothetical protein
VLLGIAGAEGLPQSLATSPVHSSTIEFQTTSYSSTAKAAVPQYFIFQEDATGNNAANPSAVLALDASSGTAAPKPTAFSFRPTGLLNFAPGQTFPGAASPTANVINIGNNPAAPNLRSK